MSATEPAKAIQLATARQDAFFDTNVLVYVFDSEAEEKQRRARQLVLDHLETRTLSASVQVITEFFWVATRKPGLPLDPNIATWFVRELLKSTIVAPSAEMVTTAMEHSARTGAPLWDTLILMAAEAARADVLYTEDRHLLALESSIRIVNPFAAV
jgi:predicted nucleic acid-binding protein